MTIRDLFRYFRIAILLFILFIVAMITWLDNVRSTDWNDPLWMVIYPINGDNSKVSAKYIDYLNVKKFSAIQKFIEEEADYFKITVDTPLQIKLAATIQNMPPSPPRDGNIFKTIWWSLEIRYWAYNNNSFQGPTPDIKIYVVYYDPATNSELDHSLGLEKGKLGIVNAFASRLYNQKNNVIITHELLHTLGASDKYNLETGLPIYPDGYGKSDQEPLYPQELAEIMGARIAISEDRAIIPNNLHQTLVGNKTAEEIGWSTN